MVNDNRYILWQDLNTKKWHILDTNLNMWTVASYRKHNAIVIACNMNMGIDVNRKWTDQQPS